MIIGIDGNEANISRRVGVNTYAYELLRNLWKLQVEEPERHSLIVYLKDKPLPDMPEETANFKYKVLRGSGQWILTKLTPELIFGSTKPDVFLTPSHYVPFLVPIPKVCSIMDLGYLDFSEQFPKKVFWQLKWWTAISIFVSKKVIAISESTKENIVRHYAFASGKVYVTHLAYDSGVFNENMSQDDVRHIKKRYSIVDDYILYLGTLKPNKNIERLIEAFHALSSEFPKTKLVIAGKKGWMYSRIFELAEKLDLTDRIVFTDFISEDEKPALIKGAKVFAIPSLWEGFGLDALNAMAAGVPVVASDRGSLPEVVGEAGVIVNPNEVDSIADGLTKVLSMNKNDYNSIVKKGLSQAGKFSWLKMARETLKILESI
jgi:glycosyltransferase involved in cell wall biosynthesis